MTQGKHEVLGSDVLVLPVRRLVVCLGHQVNQVGTKRKVRRILRLGVLFVHGVLRRSVRSNDSNRWEREVYANQSLQSSLTTRHTRRSRVSIPGCGGSVRAACSSAAWPRANASSVIERSVTRP